AAVLSRPARRLMQILMTVSPFCVSPFGQASLEETGQFETTGNLADFCRFPTDPRQYGGRFAATHPIVAFAESTARAGHDRPDRCVRVVRPADALRSAPPQCRRHRHFVGTGAATVVAA